MSHDIYPSDRGRHLEVISSYECLTEQHTRGPSFPWAHELSEVAHGDSMMNCVMHEVRTEVVAVAHGEFELYTAVTCRRKDQIQPDSFNGCTCKCKLLLMACSRRPCLLPPERSNLHTR